MACVAVCEPPRLALRRLRLEDYTPCEGRLNPSRLEDYAAPHRACHASESLTNEHVIA